MDLSLGFFCSVDLYFCLCASTILSWWLWLCSIVWSQAGWFLQFHSSLSRLLWIFKLFFFNFHTNCEIICSCSVKNTIGSLKGIALNLTNTWKNAKHHSLSEKCKSKPQWGTTSHQSEWLRSKNLQAINAGEGVEKREPSYTVGGNAN